MAVILDEAAADKQVIRSLLNEIKRLRGLQMSKILRDTDGNLYRVEHYEQITTDELEAEAAGFDAKAAELREFLGTAEPTAPVAPVQPEAPVATPEVTAPVVEPTPAPEAPAPAPTPTPTPDVQPAPVAPAVAETVAPDPTAPAPAPVVLA